MRGNVVIEEVQPDFGAKITVIGVGGGGSNAISNLVNSEIGVHQCVKIVAANTDKQHLDCSPAHFKIRLGEEITRGLGAGMRPEVGRDAAEESRDQIKEMLDGSDIVFITTGLGGGTGTGASPVIAEVAKEIGALTVSIVTTPFRYEGHRKANLAQEGLKALREQSDTIIVVPNDRLRSVIQEKKAGLKESFRIVDGVLVRAVMGIAGVMLNYGSNDMNVDFADVKTIMGHRGLALMGIGEAEGEGAATEAVKSALSYPLLDGISIDGAMGVLVNFEIGEDYPFLELEDAQMLVSDFAHPEADVKFGTITKANAGDRVKVTIIATGFEKEVIKGEENNKELQEERQTRKFNDSLTRTIDLKNSTANYGREEYLGELNIDIPTYMRETMNKKD